jgi:hypothetical protein
VCFSSFRQGQQQTYGALEQMRVVIYDRVDPPAPAEFPFRLTATCSHRSAALFLLLVLPALALIAFSTVMVIVNAALIPEARALLASRPVLGFEVLLAIALLGCLLMLPARRLFARLMLARSAEISPAAVTVTERSPFRTATWSQPLSAYAGLVHHVRASLSGVRHELILVHPEWEKSVLVSLADRMSQAEVDRVAQMMALPEIPASSLYRLNLQWPRIASLVWRDAAHA